MGELSFGMLKITDQYFWNFWLLVLFGVLLVMATIILETESRIPLSELSLFDLTIIVLASWRLMRFVSSDGTTKFFREQFYDLKKTVRTLTLEKPVAGPRRTILDIILCPWSFGLGSTALVTFFYLLTTYAIVPVMLLALSGVVALFELVARLLIKKGED